MRLRLVLTVLLIAGFGGVAFAELQNVEIGGSLRIRGNYFNMDEERAIGSGWGMFSDFFSPAVSGGQHANIEQRTRLNVKADFTQDVSAFIELDSYDIWGEDFRSMYICGNDMRGSDNIDLYQAYIEARDMWGSPLTMRVGRQEIALGNQFLVGVNDVSTTFTGLSFDALRLTLDTDAVRIDAIAAKLAETYGDFGDNDVDFYALYGSYIGIEDVALDAYWMFVRDDQGLAAQSVFNGTTVDLHTIGLRGSGVVGGFDFEIELAYQFGDVDGVPSGCWLGFGEADVEYDNFAINSEFGYTFDASVQPRIFAGFAYLGGGEDNGNCWHPNDRTLPFNRLFSNIKYSEFLDNWTAFRSALTNLFVYKLGMQMLVAEALELKLVGTYLQSDVDFGEDDLGWEVGFYADYAYSEDLSIRAGYAHFFAQDGLETTAIGADGINTWLPNAFDDDYDYVFLETEISF